MANTNETRKQVAKGAAQEQEVKAAPAEPAFRLIKSETLTMDGTKAREVAEAHSQLPHSPTERTRDPKRVQELLNRIKLGLLLPCNWATVTYLGVKYRMNGQHSSESLVQANGYMPNKVTIHIDHYEVDTAEAMAALFRQFDARISSRTKQDVSAAYQGLSKLANCRRDNGKLAIEGIAWFERHIEGLPVKGGDDMYEMFLEEQYIAFIKWIDTILSLKTPEMKRPAIVGAMYGTFLQSESAAQEFWSNTAEPRKLTDDMDPRAVLAAELYRIKEEKDTEVKPGDFYARCVKAWNAFRGGDKIKSLIVNTKKGMPDIAA